MAKLPSSSTKITTVCGVVVTALTTGWTGLASTGATAVAILFGLATGTGIVVHWREWLVWLRETQNEGRLFVLIGMILSAVLFIIFFALWMREHSALKYPAVRDETAYKTAHARNSDVKADLTHPGVLTNAPLLVAQSPSAPRKAGEQRHPVVKKANTGSPISTSGNNDNTAGAHEGDAEKLTASQVGEQGSLRPDPILSDESARIKLRDLLSAVDARIPPRIDAGFLQIDTRITDRQFQQLLALEHTPAGEKLVISVDVLGQMRESVINNGTFGPTTAEDLQYKIRLVVSEGLRQ